MTEVKFHDLDVNVNPVVVGGTVVQDSCVLIPQGSSESDRRGRRAIVVGLEWRYRVRLLSSTTSSLGDTVRVILYVDMQCNGAAAAVTDLLESADYQSFYNKDRQSRFGVLSDTTHDLFHVAAQGDGLAFVYADMAESEHVAVDLDLSVAFDGTAGTIADLTSNNVGVVLLSKSGGRVDFESKMRVSFIG